MADIQELAKSFLTQAADRRTLAVPVAPPGVHTLGPGPAIAVPLPFSNFIPSHQEQAIEIAAELMTIANDHPGDAGLQLVLERVQQVSQRTSVELAKYTLLVFITHHPEGQRLPIPPLEEREPDSVEPSRPPGELPAAMWRCSALSATRRSSIGTGKTSRPTIITTDGIRSTRARAFPIPRIPVSGKPRTARESCSCTCTSRCSRGTTPNASASASRPSRRSATTRSRLPRGTTRTCRRSGNGRQTAACRPRSSRSKSPSFRRGDTRSRMTSARRPRCLTNLRGPSPT